MFTQEHVKAIMQDREREIEQLRLARAARSNSPNADRRPARPFSALITALARR